MVGSLQAAIAVLLLAAGLGKVRAPAPASAMLRRALPVAGRPLARRSSVRAGGVVEVVIGAFALAGGTRAAVLLLALAYLVFAAISLRLLVLDRGGGAPRTSCGCFGQVDAPVGWAHVGLNVAALGIAVAAFVDPPGRWSGLFDADLASGVVAAAQVGVLAYLGFLTITALPELAAARRRVSA